MRHNDMRPSTTVWKYWKYCLPPLALCALHTCGLIAMKILHDTEPPGFDHILDFLPFVLLDLPVMLFVNARNEFHGLLIYGGLQWAFIGSLISGVHHAWFKYYGHK